MATISDDVTVDTLLEELNRYALLKDRVEVMESRIEERSRRYAEAQEIGRIQHSL